MSEKFLGNRLKYHTASRVGAKEQDPLLNALNRDQHTVHYKDVWTSPTEDFPINTGTYKDTTDSTGATDNLIEVFKNGATSVDFRNGKIWTNTNYPAVKLYEAVDMHPVAGSNGSGILYQSYEVLDDDDIRLQDWVSPMAVFDPVKDKPVPGYAGKLELNLKNTSTWVEVQKTDKSTASGVQGSVWDASYGNWEFVYSAGMAIFNADYTPTRYASAFTTDTEGVVKLRWTGFLYTGDYASDKQVIDHVDLTTGTVSTYPVNDTDISNKKYVDDKAAAGASDLSTHNLSVDAHPNGFNHTIDMHSNDVTNVKDLDADTITSTSLTVDTVAVTDSVDIANVLTVDEVNVGDKLALHDKQIKNMFAGATLPDTTNLDTYVTTGITRITNNINGTKPPISDCSGFLQVMDIDHDDDTTSMKNYRRVRQIIYPDNKDESTPYSRVGQVDSLDGTITWSEWTQMGGGSLRRVVINGTTTPVAIAAVNNVMYESFGANTFTMPDPDTVPVGTRIGFEQFIGTATVTCGTLVQTLSADTPLSDYSSLPAADAISYIFECVISQDGSSREWMLDIDHNYAAAVDTLNGRIVAANDALNDLADHVDAIDLAAETLLARQTKHMICANDGYTLTSTAPTADNKASDEAWQTFLNSSKFNLYFYDLICSVTVGGKTVTLPNTTVPGACVTVEIIGGLTCTVKTANGSVTQSFTADANTILVLEFEYTRINASTNGWTLLSMA